MTVLDSAAAIRRALAAIGHPDGAGRCLENVFQWFGSVESIGAGHGHYGEAIEGWNYATQRSTDIESAPAGVPVYFGVSPTRTDRNRAAGDIGLSIGGGRGIFTDSPSGTPGIMTFRARGLQIDRPPLGFDYGFLGHETTAGIAALDPKNTSTTNAGPIVVRKKGDDGPMYAVRNASNGAVFALSPGRVQHLAAATQASDLAKVSSTADETHSLSEPRLRTLFMSFNVPVDAVDPNWLSRHENDGGRTWSKEGETRNLLLAAIKAAK